MPDELNLTGHTTLDFLLAATEEKPGPRKLARDNTKNDSTENRRSNESGDETERDEDEDEDDEPIDLSIVVTDANGSSASVPLSRYGPVRKPLEISILRRKDIERERYTDNFDLVLQTYSILLEDFSAANDRIDISRLMSIRFDFDRSEAGTVIVDDIGFSALRPGFTRVSAARP
jgi:hypothetical protein